MAAEMLCAYYARDCDSDKMFDNLEIGQSFSYKEHLNQYDVLFLNMQQFLSGAKCAENIATYLQKAVLAELREGWYCL